MEFPVAGVTVSVGFLIFIGFLVGVLGGFFGVGGGFIAGPLMFWGGVPFNFVVGTDLAHMTGKSIVAARRHHRYGHVDVRLGLIMIAGTMIGIEAGAQLIEALQARGSIDQVVGTLYVVILFAISAIMGTEAWRAWRRAADDAEEEPVTTLARRLQRIRLRPMVALPASGIAAISVWVVLGVGAFSGFLAGLLGVGGGFIRMPLLVYVIGVPTHVAVGTDLFEIVVSAGYGTLTHAIKGNVDILMALVMQTGAAIGARIGTSATRRVSGPQLRFFFALLPIVGAVLVLIRLLG